MKKLAKIQDSDNGLRINLEGGATFVKIFNNKGKLIRHSRFSNKQQVIFYEAPAEYFVESDGKIGEIESENFGDRDPGQLAIKVQDSDDNGVKSFSIFGKTVSPSRVEALVRKQVITDVQVKESIVNHFDEVGRKLKAEILTEEITKDLAIGAISSADKTKLKKEVEKVNTERERVKKIATDSNNITDLIKIKTKFDFGKITGSNVLKKASGNKKKSK